jgi:hypothetical protein
MTLPANTPVPPEVAHYLQGATQESRQFDFLIGEWNVAATRFAPDGSVLLQYPALWTAQYLNEGRMVLDDFKALAPTGQPLSSFVTLRTYSYTTGRWEMTGLAAHQPAASAHWSGILKDGEMRLDATGVDAHGKHIHTRIRFFDIEQDCFAWESRSSLDQGSRWTLNAALTARRVGSAR